MALLEARFHPHRKDGNDVLVVGRIRCSGSRATIESVTHSNGAGDPAVDAMIEKLQYLVRTSGTPPFERLLALRSEFWSFVEIEEPQGGAR
jgi:hypothetical protein